jgi:hypothetical protein
MGFSSPLATALSETTYNQHWEKYQRSRIQSRPTSELEQLALQWTPFDGDEALFVLAERGLPDWLAHIRKAIDDRFEQHFAAALHRLSVRYPGNEEIIQKTSSVSAALRRDYTRQALDIIEDTDESTDLFRVRSTLNDGFVPVSSSDFHYLERNGEWDDVKLIIKLTENFTPSSATSLLFGSGDQYQPAANALVTLGRSRLPDLLSVPMPNALLKRVVMRIPDRWFRELSDPVLMNLFASEDDGVRKSTALKAVKVFAQRRVKELLRRQETLETGRYYNVAVWLDLGASVSHKLAVSAAKNILSTLETL